MIYLGRGEMGKVNDQHGKRWGREIFHSWLLSLVSSSALDYVGVSIHGYGTIVVSKGCISIR